MLDAVEVRKEIIRVDRLKQENAAERSNEVHGSEYERSLKEIISYYQGYGDGLRMVLSKSSMVADAASDEEPMAPRKRHPKPQPPIMAKRGRGRPRKSS